MKHFYTIFLALCYMLITSSPVQAQEITTNSGIEIDNISITHVANRVEVDFSIFIEGVKVRPNKALRITPLLTNGNEMIQLPAVVIDGRRRHIMHMRNENHMIESSTTYIRHRKRDTQEVDYSTDVAFEGWMRKSELILREECISCHDMALDEAFTTVATLNEEVTPAAAMEAMNDATTKPQMAYVTPCDTDSCDKTPSSAEILFAVNQCAINPSFMDNAAHISQLDEALKQSDKIKAIHLMGYASPEGPYQFNKTLAAKRAEAIKKHLVGKNLPADILLLSDSSPADWQEVKNLLMGNNIANYQEIIAIIDNDSIAPANKNKTIKQTFPVEYDYMLRVWYPKLRKTEITIEHQEKDLSVNEAKAQLKQNPESLSLEDIYMVALTYDKHSKEWDEIILFAVEAYPQSPEARINAANVAMDNGDYKLAAEYLNGVPQDIPQAMNSRGILAMAEGRYQDAMQLFEAAEKAGVSEATENIALLKQLMDAEN